MTELPLGAAATGLVAGLAIGAAYFALLHRAVRLHTAAAPLRQTVALHLLRGALALGGFWMLVQLGSWALLSGLAGFLAARALALRLVKSA